MARPRKFDDDTRATLIRDAAELIATGGVESVSLRPLAARHGCSTTAIYTTFGSRDGLIAAVRKEAVASFTRDQEAAPVLGNPVEDLLTLGRVYRQWALKFPPLYSVMFVRAGPPFQAQEVPAPVVDCRPGHPSRAMRPLHDRVKDCVAAGVFESHPVDEICGSIRAGVHGWVTLEAVHSVVPGVDGDAAYERYLQSLLTAWSPKATVSD